MGPIQDLDGPDLRVEERNGSGGEARTLNISVNSRTLCRLSYPGMASEISSARTRPMIVRWVVAQPEHTCTQPNSCLFVRDARVGHCPIDGVGSGDRSSAWTG